MYVPFLVCDVEDRGSMSVRNFGMHLQDNAAF